MNGRRVRGDRLAYMTAKADEALPVSAESVVALVVEAVEHAESILRGAARAGGGGGGGGGGAKGPNPVVSALRAAAVAVLEDCETQCEAEATLVRDQGGLQVTPRCDSRRVDNQLRGALGARVTRVPPSSACPWRTS